MTTSTSEGTAEIAEILDKLVKAVVKTERPSAISQGLESGDKTVVYTRDSLTVILRQEDGEGFQFDAAAITHPRGFLEVVNSAGRVSIVTDEDTFNVIPSVHPEVYDNVLQHFHDLAKRF